MKKGLVWIFGALLLAGCGGGGGSDSAAGGQSAAAGAYVGQDSNATQDIVTIVLPSGEYFAVYGDLSTSDLWGAVHGTGTTSGANFTDASATDYQVNNSATVAASLTATYHAGLSFSGTLTEAGGALTFSLTDAGLTPVTLAGLQGVYSGDFENTTNAGAATATIDAAGVVQVADASGTGCTLAGNASLQAGVTGIYHISLTYEAGADCGAAYAGKTVSGVAYLNDNDLYVAMTGDSGAIGVLFSGSRPAI